MTSWIRYSRPLVTGPSRDELDVVLQTGDNAGFCTQFTRYFYHVQYARRLGKTLQMKDFPNCLGDDYPLIRNTFRDISGVAYPDTLPTKASNQDMKVYDAVGRIPRETLRLAAQEVLRWRPSLEEQINTVLRAVKFPGRFDAGVHIRTGDKKAVSLERYLRALEQYAASQNLKTMRVFVACDNATVLKDLQARTKGSPYEFVTLGGDHPVGGHFQKDFNAKPFDDKYNDAMTFFTELYVLQKCPAIFCTLSSNVGRFLYLTANSIRNFRSLDLADFVPL
jgi:hypothetical protein